VQWSNPASSTSAPKKSITWVPLLVGKVSFGRYSNKFILLLHHELDAKDVLLMKDSDSIGVCLLLSKLKESEHPLLSKKNESEMNDEEKRKVRYFYLKFLTTEDWSNDKIDETLKNL